MKQVIRKVINRKGVVQVEPLPTPHVGDDQVLVSTHYSLISSGTESATLDKNPVELVKQTLQDPWMRNAVKNLVFSGGVQQTIDTVLNELDIYRMIGYSGAGIVLAKGKHVQHVQVGDRVGFAAQGHAEQVAPYANHVVKVPDNVDLRHAAFVTVGAIAMQGVRRAECNLGDWVVVYGLGLVGQITAQILAACGARVIGLDVNEQRLQLATQCGIRHVIDPKQEGAIDAVLRLTEGKGADRTVICAVSQNPEIANNAMKMTRKQGRVVFVGIVKMDLERKPFFLNELEIAFSRAYGPGSYDSAYEKGRVDYPYHYVRWTENRNLAEVLRLVDDGLLKIEPLIDSEFPMEQAQAAFDKIRSGEMKSVAMLLSYSRLEEVETRLPVAAARRPVPAGVIRVGVIGVGNFTRNVHVPNLSRNRNYHIRALCTATGVNAGAISQKHQVDYVTSEYREVLDDPEIDMVLIATRHDLHAKIVIEAAQAGKHILVEKPVALTMEEWEAVRAALGEHAVHFMIGYNRRYSATAQRALQMVRRRPVLMKYTVNIQHLPDSHWTLDSIEGGGRLLGEADHFFDLMNCFADSHPVLVQALSLPASEERKEGLFNFMVQVKYANESLAQLTYTSMGGPSLPRERLEIFNGSRFFEVVDFKRLRIDGRNELRQSDMGHEEELEVFARNIKSDDPAVRERELDGLWAGWIALQADDAIRGGQPKVDKP